MKLAAARGPRFSHTRSLTRPWASSSTTSCPRGTRPRSNERLERTEATSQTIWPLRNGLPGRSSRAAKTCKAIVPITTHQAYDLHGYHQHQAQPLTLNRTTAQERPSKTTLGGFVEPSGVFGCNRYRHFWSGCPLFPSVVFAAHARKATARSLVFSSPGSTGTTLDPRNITLLKPRSSERPTGNVRHRKKH